MKTYLLAVPVALIMFGLTYGLVYGLLTALVTWGWHAG